jgi:two-component system chemotaxis response regulator CheB
VLVVDDSAVVRRVLTEILNQDPKIKVVGSAGEPYQAVEKIKKLRPDVLTLDIEMPRMSGLEFLRRLMSTFPLPVVMISSLTRQGSKETIEALEAGAVDFVAKPDLVDEKKRIEFSWEVIQKVKGSAAVTPRQINESTKSPHSSRSETPKIKKSRLSQVIGIGASTGGVKTIKQLIPNFPVDSPGIIIVQHMPKGFTTSFANTLDQVSQLKVKEAEDRAELKSGQALIVPGGYHLEVKKKGRSLRVSLNQKPKVNHQRPSVDVTFNSLAEEIGADSIAVLLTGMGKDGAQGLKKIKEAGGYTLAQNKETATIFGMPKKAIELEAASEVVSLGKVVDKIIQNLNQ